MAGFQETPENLIAHLIDVIVSFTQHLRSENTREIFLKAAETIIRAKKWLDHAEQQMKDQVAETNEEFIIPAKVTHSHSSGYNISYIYLHQPKTSFIVKKTIPLLSEYDNSWIANLDLDEDGHVIGIELMDGKMTPKKPETSNG